MESITVSINTFAFGIVFWNVSFQTWVTSRQAARIITLHTQSDDNEIAAAISEKSNTIKRIDFAFIVYLFIISCFSGVAQAYRQKMWEDYLGICLAICILMT